MKRIALCFTATFIVSFNLIFSQNFQNLNNLPPTVEVKAPNFNTLKSYFFKVDTLKNNLIIQDLRSSNDGKISDYQWLYEIPLNELTNNSFSILIDELNENEVQLVIHSKSKSILSYMFLEGKVVTISSLSSLYLGNWNYSKELVETLNNNITLNSNFLPKSEPFNFKSNNAPVLFKYVANNVQTINAIMDDDVTIGNGYYLGHFNNLSLSAIKKIKNTLKSQKIKHTNPLPVVIYTDKSGNIELIFTVNKPNEKYAQFNLSTFKSLKPTQFKNKNVPAKYVFLIN